MAVDLVKNTVTLSGAGGEINGEITVSETIRLGDNMSSVKKIVFSDESVLLKSCETYVGGAAIKGEVHSTIVYLGENEAVDSLSVSLPFEYLTETSAASSGAVLVKCNVSRVEVLPMKQRRIDLNVTVQIGGFCSAELAYDNLSGIEGVEGMNYLRDEHTATLMRSMLSGREVANSFSIGSVQPGKIIYCGSSLSDIATNSSASGILLNASVNQYVIYTTENDEGLDSYHTYSDSFAINQFIETPFGESYDHFELTPYLAMNEAEFLYNEAGEIDIEVRGDISTAVTLFKNVKYPVVCDMFSTSGVLDIKYDEAEYLCLEEVIRDTVTLNESAKINPSGINKLAAGKQRVNVGFKWNGGSIDLFGELNSDALILKSNEADIETAEIKAEFSWNKRLDPNGSEIYVYADVDKADYEIRGDEVILRADISIKVFVASSVTEYETQSASISAFDADEDNYVTIKVRYIAEGENIWTIAKENRTSIAQILSANNIDKEDLIKPNQPIIIRNF